MIKLFILDDVSAFSSDAVFKICLALEEKGLTQDDIERFSSYDELLDAIVPALEQGDHIIVAPENSDYNAIKRDIITKLILEEQSSPVIAEAIATNAGEDLSEIDISGHSLVPANSNCLITTDGLYCGFTTTLLNGRLTYIPLDFMRVDLILQQLKEKVIEREERLEELGLDREIEMPDFDLVPCVTDMVNALHSSEQTVALATGEATMWIYNLFDKVENLTETIKFVEIIDDESADYSSETESAMIIRHAREAMINLSADFGAAISDIYSSENADGKTVYFAYAALVDKGTAKAKKINISDPNNLSIVLPHAVTLLSDMLCKKIDANSRALTVTNDNAETEKAAPTAQNPQQIVLSSRLVLFLLCAVVAIVVPIILVFTVFDKDEPTTQVYNPNTYMSTSTTQATTKYNPFDTQTTTGSILNSVTEPSAADISATSTTTSEVSTSGVFTFYVFGYGHGVGMSQTGANYYAKQGWNFAEILAHYYYDANASLVVNDTYPEKITYAGSSYETREYLAKALEAEMGSSFHYEALKAQAIAIYTFAKHYNYNLSQDAHAFTAGTPSSTVYAVVDEVMKNGFYISYAGDVALTPFHSMSAGKTTSYYNVWGKSTSTSVSYLNGGRLSYGDYESSDFKSVFTISSADLKKLIESSDLGVTLTGDPATWLSIVTHDQAVREDIGYVSTINVGGKIITGYDFRISVMQGKIRSHCFALTYTPD